MQKLTALELFASQQLEVNHVCRQKAAVVTEPSHSCWATCSDIAEMLNVGLELRAPFWFHHRFAAAKVSHPDSKTHTASLRLDPFKGCASSAGGR